MQVTVVDYGMGNVGSIVNMLRKIGATAQVTASAADIETAGSLVLPGVGSFDAGMAALRRCGIEEALGRRMRAGVPILGICLGMQILGRSSAEGTSAGLAWLQAESVRVDAAPPIHVPHIGWTSVEHCGDPLFDSIAPGAEFYFMHSYEIRCDDPAQATASFELGGRRVAAVRCDNVVGVQFHPEKSHDAGIALFRNFLAAA